MSAPTGEDASVAERKRLARADVRRARRARALLPPGDPTRTAEARALAEAVFAGVEQGPDGGRLAGVTLGPGATVASYVSLPTEPPTDALNAALLDRGVRVLVPVLLDDLDLDWAPLEVADADAAAAGEPAAAGAPLGRDAIGAATLVVVPALRVDAAGRRLGQGGGSYDRALARRAPDAVVVALVDDDGLVAEVPHEPHDAVVDAVVRAGHGWTPLPGVPGS